MKQHLNNLLPPTEIPALSEQRRLGVERKWWVLMALGIGTLMTSLDAIAVNTVLPVIRDSFATTMSSIEWVVMSYLIIVSSLLLSFGRMGDIFGHKRVYSVGLVIFITGSLLCALAPSEAFLIGFRALEGFGFAMIASNASAILTWTFPQAQRGQAIGLLVMMTYFGMTIGPSLGGYLTDQFGWRSIFYINLPIGVIAAVMALLIIPRYSSGQKRESFDVAGAVALLIGLASLMFGLSKGQEMGWTSVPIVGLFVVALAFIALFLRVERVVRFPMLDLDLFSSRLFSFATVSACINYLCIFSALFLLPFYLVQGRGFSPGFAGLLITAQPVAMVIVAPLAGRLSDRIGSRALSTTGMVFLAAGMFMFSRLTAQATEMDVILPLVIMGIGNGFFVSPNSSAILGSVPRQRLGIAAGVVATARNLGMVLGIAISGAIFSTQLAQRSFATGDPQAAFFGAFQFTFVAIGLIATAGAATSLIRGPSGSGSVVAQ